MRPLSYLLLILCLLTQSCVTYIHEAETGAVTYFAIGGKVRIKDEKVEVENETRTVDIGISAIVAAFKLLK